MKQVSTLIVGLGLSCLIGCGASEPPNPAWAVAPATSATEAETEASEAASQVEGTTPRTAREAAPVEPEHEASSFATAREDRVELEPRSFSETQSAEGPGDFEGDMGPELEEASAGPAIGAARRRLTLRASSSSRRLLPPVMITFLVKLAAVTLEGFLALGAVPTITGRSGSPPRNTMCTSVPLRSGKCMPSVDPPWG